MKLYKLSFPLIFSILYILVWIGIAIVSIWWTPYEPYGLQSQSILQSPNADHWLGTDALGRDMWSRIMKGSTITLGISIFTAFTTMMVGIIVGLIGAYQGGWMDRMLQMIVSIFQSIPSISFMIALAGILEPGIMTIIIAITCTAWVNFSRIIRAEVLALKHRNYIVAIRHMGASHWYILYKYIGRSVLPTLIVLFTTRIAYTMLAMSALSFIGLGIQPPLADWGLLVEEGYTYFRTYPALLYAPGICIVTLGMAINYVGEYMKDYFERGRVDGNESSY